MADTVQVDQRRWPQSPQGQQLTPVLDEISARLDLVLVELQKQTLILLAITGTPDFEMQNFRR